jgi:hypothetical protein
MVFPIPVTAEEIAVTSFREIVGKPLKIRAYSAASLAKNAIKSS